MLTRQLFNLTRKGHRFYSTGTNVLTKPLTLRNVSKEGKITSDQLFGGKKVRVLRVLEVEIMKDIRIEKVFLTAKLPK
jgi:hypothetical protein